MTRHRARPSFTVEIKRSRTSPLPDGERPQSERPVSKPSGFSNPAEALFKPPAAAKPLAAAKPAASAPAPHAPAPSEPETRPASPGRNLWAGTGLFEETAAATQSGRFDPPDLPIFGKAPAEKPADKIFSAKEATPAREAAPAKRVLPSLIAPPEPEPQPEVAPEPEAKLPRVRRYRAAEPAPRRTPGPRPAFVWPEDWPDEAPIQTPAPITVPAAARRPDGLQARIELPKTETAPPPASEEGEIRPRVKRRTDEDLRIGQRWKRRLPRVCW